MTTASRAHAFLWVCNANAHRLRSLWDILITELDRESATAKIRFTDEDDAFDDKRVRAIITDPSVAVIGNAYVTAFASHSEMRVRGKAVLRDGEIQTLYISDVDQPLT